MGSRPSSLLKIARHPTPADLYSRGRGGADAGRGGAAGVMLSVVSPEHRIRPDHPLLRIKAMADAELARLSPVFDAMYAERGRPVDSAGTPAQSVPADRLYSV